MIILQAILDILSIKHLPIPVAPPVITIFEFKNFELTITLLTNEASLIQFSIYIMITVNDIAVVVHRREVGK